MGSKSRIAALTAVIGTAAASALIGLTGSSEGLSLAPYNDQIGAHVETVCYGETNVPMQRYTRDECKDILAGSLAGYAKAVRASVPGFDSLTDGEKVAAIDYTYNRGIGSWNRPSRPGEPPSVLAAYRVNDFPGACELYPRWALVSRAGKWVDCSIRSNGCYGIYVRRMKERAACLGQ